MHSFTSKKADFTYVISLPYGRVETIKAKTGIDLLEGEANEVFMDLWAKPRTRMDVLWAMIDDKSDLPMLPCPDHDPDTDGDEPKKLSRRESFDSIMFGETLRDAGKAFWDELCFFFQNLYPERKAYLEQMIEEMKSLSEKQTEAITELTSDPKKLAMMDKFISQAKDKTFKVLEKRFGDSLDELE